MKNYKINKINKSQLLMLHFLTCSFNYESDKHYNNIVINIIYLLWNFNDMFLNIEISQKKKKKIQLVRK